MLLGSQCRGNVPRGFLFGVPYLWGTNALAGKPHTHLKLYKVYETHFLQ